MALIDITPIMTSNTTPAPYVVSASSVYDNTREAFRAFNGILDRNDGWVTESTTATGWIKIDFGNVIKVSAISIYAFGNKTTIKSCILYGSNDDSNYEELIHITQQIDWNENSRLFKLNNSVNFRYYKLNITESNFTYTGISGLKFWQEDSPKEYITNKKASLNYCLPKNSTLAMTQRSNDYREGLLGFTNDPDDRYGTLYLIDNRGKAIIPKAAMTDADILFNGIALGNLIGPTDNFLMIDSYEKYKYLLIIGGVYNGGAVISHVLIPVNIIKPGIVTQCGLSQYMRSTMYYGMYFGFTSSNTFKISSTLVGSEWKTPAISKIYGIK